MHRVELQVNFRVSFNVRGKNDTGGLRLFRNILLPQQKDAFEA